MSKKLNALFPPKPSIIQDHLTLLGFKDDLGKIENAHRTERKCEEKPRNIIVKLYSRPFEGVLLHDTKNQENKQALKEVRFVEDFNRYDFRIQTKALPIVKEHLTKGRRRKAFHGQ